jgi:hypothetical protein
MKYSWRSLVFGRGAFDTALWLLALLFGIGSVVLAVIGRLPWSSAAAGAVAAVAYTFLPWIQRWNIERGEARAGTVTVDDWGVTRVAGRLREAVAWKDLVWVRIYTSGAGPGAEDVYFALGAADGTGCLVSHRLAVRVDLLKTLQERLPELDNMQVAVAMGSTKDAYFTIWTRPDHGGPPPVPPSALN